MKINSYIIKSESNLEGADLAHTKIVSFTCGKHLGFIHVGSQYPDGNICKIGCVTDSLQNWCRLYEDIGRANDYNKQV